jgi:hypothetical protein
MAREPLEVLQKLGGWKSLEMMQRYAHQLAPDYIAGYAENSALTQPQNPPQSDFASKQSLAEPV